MKNNVHNRCLICNSRQLLPLDGYGDLPLVQCAECHFVFVRNIPNSEELAEVYDNYGRDDYLSPITVKRFNQILDHLEKFRKTNRLLDVGCGIGYFLEAAKKRGWEVYGTEYTDEAVAICRAKGINMHPGKLNADNYELNSFDVIVSIEVFEHINNPHEEAENFHKLLRAGGLVYLTTPNFDSISRRWLKKNWNVITYPEHLCYFTPRSVRRLFSEIGFRPEKIRTTGISVTRMKCGITSTHECAVSPTSFDEKLRKTLEANPVLRWSKSLINETLTWLKAGDNLKATFIKT